MTIKTFIARTVAAGAMALAIAAPAKADWSGLYIAGSIGWIHNDVDWSWDIGGGFTPATASNSADSLMGGLHFGGQRQWGQLVVGLEGSIYMMHLSDYTTNPNSFIPGLAKDFESKMNWLGTITPRIGWNLGQWMPYIKGGYAVAELRTSTFFSPNGAIQTSSKDYVHGWTIGGGLEWKIRSNVTLGIEYDYVRLNGDDRLLVDTFNGTVPSNHFIGDIELHQVMVRLNVLIPHGRLEEALK